MPRLGPDLPGSYRPPRLATLRSSAPLVILLLGFCFFLSSYSLLSHFRGPAQKQHLGWQSWDVIEVLAGASGSQDVETDAASNTTDTSYGPSIPLDDWNPLAIHTTGLTEIAIKSCYFPPHLFASYCAPGSTPQLDRDRGRWVVVERDLNLKTGLWYNNIYYRRTRRLDVPLVAHIRVLPEPPPTDLADELSDWVKADGDLHSGVWPSQSEWRLWYKTREQFWDGWKRAAPGAGAVQRRTAFDDADIITELDVVYGEDAPFFGFTRVEGGPVTDRKEGRWESVDVAFRRGNPIAPTAPQPRFHSNGTYKIMQIADLHYSVGKGECRDTDDPDCIGDEDTATWLAAALDAERPDLVVFSGDQLNGQGTSYDSRSVLAKFAKPVIDREIAWAAVFGNHDSEIADDRIEQMRALSAMPYSLAKPGPGNVDGVGNYAIKLRSPDASRTHIFTLYFLDSHAEQKVTLPWVKADYDYLKTSQIEWFRNVSSHIKPIQRPFTPDGADDLGNIWRARSLPSRLDARQTSKLARPNAMMWFHIPLPEAYNDADTDRASGQHLEMGDQLDTPGSSKHNSGFFYNAIKESYEQGGTDGDVEWFGDEKVTEVKVLSHGHCHNTDRCRRVDGVWMCFDGGSSFSGYGLLGFDRRVRIYTLSDWGETIATYKRLTNGETIDHETLVGAGAPPDWGKDQYDNW
ncbi:Phosphatase dcr2 [Cryptotrichosporon argae]